MTTAPFIPTAVAPDNGNMIWQWDPFGFETPNSPGVYPPRLLVLRSELSRTLSGYSNATYPPGIDSQMVLTSLTTFD